MPHTCASSSNSAPTSTPSANTTSGHGFNAKKLEVLISATNAVGHVHLIIATLKNVQSLVLSSLRYGAKVHVYIDEERERTDIYEGVHSDMCALFTRLSVQLSLQALTPAQLTQLGRPEVDNVVDAVIVDVADSHRLSRYNDLLQKCRRLRIPYFIPILPHSSTIRFLSPHESDDLLSLFVSMLNFENDFTRTICRKIRNYLPDNLGSSINQVYDVYKSLITPRPPCTSSSTLRKSSETISICESNNETSDKLTDLIHRLENVNLENLSQVVDLDVDQQSRTSEVVKSPTSIKPSESATSPCTLCTTANNQSNRATTPTASLMFTSPTQICLPSTQPMITLAGAGPGHPSLLTLATIYALSTHDVILADKLISASVLSLIPTTTKVHIARKFPGKSCEAQNELLSLGLSALQEGKNVLRLKQGDPFLFGRGGEELDWFSRRGYRVNVLPGVSSAIAGPVCAGVPLTMRDRSEMMEVRTGTEKGGRVADIPSFRSGVTIVWLMSLHILEVLVNSMLKGVQPDSISIPENDQLNQSPTTSVKIIPRTFEPYPPETPCAIIERASCPDQRVIRSTLDHIVEAFQKHTPLPPGLLIVGKSCDVALIRYEASEFSSTSDAEDTTSSTPRPESSPDASTSLSQCTQQPWITELGWSEQVYLNLDFDVNINVKSV